MFSDILNFGALSFSLYNVDMVTSKYCKFGYASMCGNILKTCVTTNPALLCAPRWNSYNVTKAAKCMISITVSVNAMNDDVKHQNSFIRPSENPHMSYSQNDCRSLNALSMTWPGITSHHLTLCLLGFLLIVECTRVGVYGGVGISLLEGTQDTHSFTMGIGRWHHPEVKRLSDSLSQSKRWKCDA